jgi:mRNA interferase HigB
MNVISRKKLKTFFESKPEHKKHSQAFEAWFKLARKARWQSFQDARSTFGQTDVTGDTRTGKTATIFDVGGNKYRIITLIDYRRQTILITHVLTHKEYDREKWKNEI